MSNRAKASPEADLDPMLHAIESLEIRAENWGEAERRGADARVEAVDALNAEAFRRLIRALQPVPGMAAAMKAAMSDEVVYAVLRRHGILKPSLHERVENALDTVRPFLESHGGNAEIISINGDRVDISFTGACDGCPAAELTFYSGVRKAIQAHVPEIKEIVKVRGLNRVRTGEAIESPFASPGAPDSAPVWQLAAALEDIAKDGLNPVTVKGLSLLLVRIDDDVVCWENSCAHMALPMDEGSVRNGVLTCPHHGFQFSIATGECLTVPEVHLRKIRSRIRDANIEVCLE